MDKQKKNASRKRGENHKGHENLRYLLDRQCTIYRVKQDTVGIRLAENGGPTGT